MKQGLIDVNSLKVASPCSARWADMAGDERARHCVLCNKSVYNVEGMSIAEVGDLIKGSAAMPCLRLRRRKDGTVITSDCPVGRLAMWRRVAVAGFCGLFFLMSGLGLAKVAEKASPNRTEPKSLEELARGTPVIGELIEFVSPSPTYIVGDIPTTMISPPPAPTGPGASAHVGLL